MFVGRNPSSFSSILGSSSNIHFSETRINRDITTRSGDIKLVNCSTVGGLKTTSGKVDLEQGSVEGPISTRSGNISTDNTEVQGRIETDSGEISLNDSYVAGDVQSGKNAFSIHRTKVIGTLSATGESLHIGSFSYIEKIVMHAPRAANVFGQGRRIPGSSIVNAIRDSDLFPDGGRISPSNASTDQTRRMECQTIFLGTGTQVRDIEFEAAHCRIVLGPHAEYLGSPTEGMSIEREGRPAHSTTQAFNARFNPRPQADSSIPQHVSLPDATDFSEDANNARICAMDLLLDTEMSQTRKPSSRQLEMGKIGEHYIDALDRDGADKLQSVISALNDEAKAKTLTAIIYGTLSELDLDDESPVCKALEDLCNGFKDRAGMIKSHIKTIDHRGTGGSGVAEHGAARVGIDLLNEQKGRLPYATEMMLNTLGLSRSENQQT